MLFVVVVNLRVLLSGSVVSFLALSAKKAIILEVLGFKLGLSGRWSTSCLCLGAGKRFHTQNISAYEQIK